MGISEVPVCHLLWQMSSQWASQKLFKDRCLMNSHPTFLFLTFLNLMNYGHITKACNFELHNSLKLNFTNIWCLRSNFVDFESFLESNSPDILAVCETNLDDSIDSGSFSVRGYLPLIPKDSSTHMHCLTVYVKEGLPLEKSADSYLCFRLALLLSMFYVCLSYLCGWNNESFQWLNPAFHLGV